MVLLYQPNLVASTPESRPARIDSLHAGSDSDYRNQSSLIQWLSLPVDRPALQLLTLNQRYYGICGDTSASRSETARPHLPLVFLRGRRQKFNTGVTAELGAVQTQRLRGSVAGAPNTKVAFDCRFDNPADLR